MKAKIILSLLPAIVGATAIIFMMAGCRNPLVIYSPKESSTGSITGKVVASGQTDNSGITVTAESTDGIKSLSVQKTLSARQASKAVISAQAVADGSGAYTLTGLSPGTYTLSAVSKDGLARAVSTSVTVNAGSATQAALMVLTQTGKIQGSVTLADGSDPLGIVVFIAGTSYSAMTDSSGNYLMSWVPAGTNYTLVASKTGYVSEIRPVDVKVNKTTPMAPLVLATYVPPQTTGSVSGTATLGDAPTARAGIFVYLAGSPYICVTNESGVFSLSGVPSDNYTIMASKEGYTAQSAPVFIPQGPAAPQSFILTPVGPYFVIYYPNEGSGNVPVDPNNYLQGFRATVLGNTGNLVKAGHSFAGWNTKADGTGVFYVPGQTILMGASNTELYAVWIPTPVSHTLSGKVLHESGEPASGVTVGFAGSKTVTAGDGSFSIDLGAGTGTVTGDFYWYGGGKRVMYVAGCSCDRGTDNVLTLYGESGEGSPGASYGFQGRIYERQTSQEGVEIPDGSKVNIVVRGMNGGRQSGSATYSRALGCGSDGGIHGDCLITATVAPPPSTGLSPFNIVAQANLSSPSTQIDLYQDIDNSTAVTVHGDEMGNMGALSLVSSYGSFPAANFAFSSSSSATVRISNPYGFQGFWTQMKMIQDNPSAGYSKAFTRYSGIAPIADSVVLPMIDKSLGSSLGAADPATLSYLNGTLSVSPVSGASMYAFGLRDDNTGHGLGSILSSSASVSLPPGIQNILAGKSVRVSITPTVISAPWDVEMLRKIGSNGGSGPDLLNMEMVMVDSASGNNWKVILF